MSITEDDIGRAEGERWRGAFTDLNEQCGSFQGLREEGQMRRLGKETEAEVRGGPG